mmetsp:Transcript_75967/g.180687  ORF Transcript_75967/g.180687 Transcript_75967/m.180687 type:complete len:646 (+) Transcript_75967:55-1992(+)
MAIDLCRSSKKCDEYLSGLRTTGENVAPGSYSNTHNEPKERVPESLAPFNSLQEKVLASAPQAATFTPGPGAYDAKNGALQRLAETTPNFALRSSSARFAPSAPGSSVYKSSTIVDNPGPGNYDLQGLGDASLAQIKKDIIPGVRPVLESPPKTVPSIPPQRLKPDEVPPGNMNPADVANPRIKHSGEPHDMVGPGEYNPVRDPFSARSSSKPKAKLSGETSKKKNGREIGPPPVSIHFKGMPEENPGPGSYDLKVETGFAVGDGTDNEIVAPSYQFASQTQLHYQKGVDQSRLAPGPGHYGLRSAIDQSVDNAQKRGKSLPERVKFGSTTERACINRSMEQPFTDEYHIHNVPGPGFYGDCTSQFNERLRREQEVGRVLPNSHIRKMHGVHHPMLVMALQDAQGPLQAFNSTDDRPCNRPLPQRTPAPWQYSPEAASGASMMAEVRERAKVGRRGAFGTRADRFQTLPGAAASGGGTGTELGDPVIPMNRSAEPRSMFTSKTARTAEQVGPREVHATRVGGHDGPPPGAYTIDHEPNYRSPYRRPKADHLSFGTGASRFQSARDMFRSRSAEEGGPSPVDYNPMKPVRPPGHAKASARRRLGEPTGCTTDVVGPGSYSPTETTLLKKSFNVTLPLTTGPPHSAR